MKRQEDSERNETLLLCKLNLILSLLKACGCICACVRACVRAPGWCAVFACVPRMHSNKTARPGRQCLVEDRKVIKLKQPTVPKQGVAGQEVCPAGLYTLQTVALVSRKKLEHVHRCDAASVSSCRILLILQFRHVMPGQPGY